jgi:DNA-binding CsgD family transcriptional regulator
VSICEASWRRPSSGRGARGRRQGQEEVAAELHVTVRTVETHLTKIYEKLSIRARGELARRLSS